MFRKLFIQIIDLYRKYLSPLKSTKCPYYPCCSSYGREAVMKFGAFKGGFLAFYRIIRCNPFSKGGFDPVSDKFFDNITGKNRKIRYISKRSIGGVN